MARLLALAGCFCTLAAAGEVSDPPRRGTTCKVSGTSGTGWTAARACFAQGREALFDQTSLTVEDLRTQDHDARRTRYARRHRIRLIDQVINEFELLNLAGVSVVPGELTRRANGLITGDAARARVMPEDIAVPIADWVSALFEVQDALMIPGPTYSNL